VLGVDLQETETRGMRFVDARVTTAQRDVLDMDEASVRYIAAAQLPVQATPRGGEEETTLSPGGADATHQIGKAESEAVERGRSPEIDGGWDNVEGAGSLKP